MDLLLDRALSFRRSQTGCFRGICGCTQGVCAHMGDCGRLTRSSGGGRRCGSLYFTSRASRDKSAAYLVGDTQLTTSERPRPGNRLTWAAVSRSFRLEQWQHPFGAIRRPRCDDPSVSFA